MGRSPHDPQTCSLTPDLLPGSPPKDTWHACLGLHAGTQGECRALRVSTAKAGAAAGVSCLRNR